MTVLCKMIRGKKHVEMFRIDNVVMVSDCICAALDYGLRIGFFKSKSEIRRLGRQKGLQIKLYA